MRSKTMYVGLVLIAFMSGFHLHGSMTISSGQVYAQTSLPRVALSDLVYQGAFRVPQGSTDQTSFSYGGIAITFNPANNSLFMTGHDSYQRSAEMSIPAVVNNSSINSLNTATLLQLFADATDGKLNQINPSDPNWKKIGGHLVYSGKLYVTGYSYYDGGGTQVLSHFVSGTNLSVSNDVQGPYQVGNWAGIVSGYMADIPPEWQSLFGGPALTGNCCLSIISRTSLGPAASVFNPSPVGNWKRTFPASQEDERVDRERKIAGGASRRNEDSKDIGRLILRTAGRCKVQLSKGIVSTRTSPERLVESGESMSGLPSMKEPKEIGSRSEGS
jgi:hypothetical protein